jgi:hypothetical protein
LAKLVKYKTSQAELSKLQRVACLGITGVIKTTPTAAMEVLLGLPPLHLQLEAEAMIGCYRLSCNEQWKPKAEGFGHAYMSRDIEKEPILQMGSDKMILKHVYGKPFTIRFPDRSEWKKGFQPDRNGGQFGSQMAPKQKRALEPGCVAMEQGENLDLALCGTQGYSRLKYMPTRHA